MQKKTNSLQNQLDIIEQQCQRFELPCDEGIMPFRVWDCIIENSESEIVVLLHGGSGSWNHWIRNITALRERHKVLVPDLPGLGDAASLHKNYQPIDAAETIASGIKSLLGNQKYHIVAFSWGSVVGSLLAKLHQDQVKSLLLTGPASMGKMPAPLEMKRLIPRTTEMSNSEIQEANRENLCRLMIHDREKVDALAIYMQTENTRRARFKSPQFANGEYVLEGLQNTHMPVLLIFGEHDAVAVPNISAREARLMEVRPDACFEIVAGAGHWLQYECPEVFNRRCISWLKANSISP